MAWKLRKDTPQTDALPETAGLSDTAVPAEDAPQHEEQDQPLAFEPEPQPFVFSPPESDDLIPLDGPMFAPFAAEPENTEPETDSVSRPQFLSSEPAFTDDVASHGPFVPFQMDEPPLGEAAPADTTPDFPTFPAFPNSLDREEVAPSLVQSEGEMDVPRVSPFIVDVPPSFEDEPAVAGMLIIRIGSFAANFALTKDVSVIGRPDSVLQSYPDVEIELDDAVSRRHAEIRHRDGEYFLVDLESTNGTLLNGRRLEAEREYHLAHGDRIHVGDRTEIVFE